MNNVKNRVLLLIFFILTCISERSFAMDVDVAVVLDNSEGMCGYLNVPEATNRYKKLLTILQAAHTQSGLTMGVYFLSELPHPHKAGSDAIDKIIRTKKSCPYTHSASNLDQAIIKHPGNAKITILVTDLLFDNGVGGNSSVFDNFVNAFTELTNKDDWFNNFAGLIGITSPFDGLYYPSHGGKIHLQVERPFYLVWQASDKIAFEKLFTSLKEPLWKLKASDNDTRDIFAINLLPFTAIVPKGSEFISVTPKSWFSLIKTPEFDYVKNGTGLSKLSEQGRKEQQLDQLNPSDCFIAQSSFDIHYAKACGRDGAREKFFYKKDLSSIQLWYPIENDHAGFLREFAVQSQPASVNEVRVLSDKEGVLFDIAGIRLAGSFFNGEQSEPFVFSVTETLSIPNADNFDYSSINNWSSDNHPCENGCAEANNKTHQLQTVVKSLVGRLRANTKATEFFNKSAKPQEIRLSVTVNP